MGLMKRLSMSRDWKGFDFKLNPVDLVQLTAKLNILEDDIKDKALLKALRAGGKVFILEAQQRATSDRVAAGIRGMSVKSNGIRGYIAGPSKGLPNPAWLEYGTLDKYIGNSKKHKASYTVKQTKRFQVDRGEWWIIPGGTVISGGIRPRPFAAPAFRTKYPEMIDKMGQVLSKEILKHGNQ